MLLGLVSAEFKNNDIAANINTIAEIMSGNQCRNFDLLCFGEAFLQGFEALTWTHTIDINTAIFADGPEIGKLQEICKNCHTGLSCGYFEKAYDTQALFSSSLVIDRYGNIINNYRRISEGWKEYWHTDQMYREGNDFKPFILQDQKILTGICGDFWHAANITLAASHKPDIILWPLCIDYPATEWQNNAKQEYALQTKDLDAHILMINSVSYSDRLGKTYGGACHFYKGEIIAELPVGESGILPVQF